MNYFPLNQTQQDWQDRVAELAAREIGPRAAEYDRQAQYPHESLEALREAGLWALRVSQADGGLGADLLTTCLVVEEIAKQCPSTAMCYKMHLEASELVNRIPTPYQRERFVKPLARGEVFATVAGGETAGTTGHDWRPTAMDVSTFKRVDSGYRLDNVRKSYVTSAGHATHYLMFCRLEGRPTEGPPDFLLVERDFPKQSLLSYEKRRLEGHFSPIQPYTQMGGLEGPSADKDARPLAHSLPRPTHSEVALGGLRGPQDHGQADGPEDI